MQDERSLAYPALAVGVIAVSCAAVLTREAEAPALVIAAYRMGLASLPVGALAVVRERRELARPGALLWCTAAGVFLALHFGFWIASLQRTSVVTSVALVTTNPLFIGLASPLALGERVARATWAGIVIAGGGAALMAADDLGAGAGTLTGDLYALLGALFAAGYLMIGRRVRLGMSWGGYVGAVYPVAAVLLIGSVAVSGDALTGYDGKTYLMFALLALVPQLIGHSSINWALAYVPAAVVAVAILGEPVGATILAAIVLDETPAALEAAGALLILGGVYVALFRGRVPAG